MGGDSGPKLVGACCGLLHLAIAIVVIVFGILEYTTEYEPAGSCSGANTQKWIASLPEKQPWSTQWIAQQEAASGRPFNISGDPQALATFLDYAVENDHTEVCNAVCKGDFRTPILIFTIGFIWELVVVVCAGVAMMASGSDNGGSGAMGLVFCGFCTIILIFISGSIAITVRAAESGCWGFYVQGPCKTPDVFPILKDGQTWINNEGFCPMMWWHYLRWTWLLFPYYFLLGCCGAAGQTFTSS